MVDGFAGTAGEAEESLLFLASTAMRMGDKAGALESLERFISVTPHDRQPPEVYQAMAELREGTFIKDR